MLKPLIGLLAAIAVGVGAAFVAVNLAPTASPVTSIPTVEATLLEPVADDAEFPAATDADITAGTGNEAPPVVVEVPDPDSAPPAEATPVISADVESALVEASAVGDPYFALVGLLPWLSSTIGDPCAIDPEPSGCPGGVTARVLGGELAPLAASIEYGGRCGTSRGRNLLVSVRTNSPAEIVGTMRSGARSVDVSTSTDATEAAEWTPNPYRVIYHCLASDGWERGATVDVDLVVTDYLGRTVAVNRSLVVPTSAAAVRPDAQILGLSGNLVQVSAPFSSGQAVGVGWVDAESGTCTFAQPGADAGSGVSVLRPQTISPISADYLEDNGWLPAYDQWATTVFLVTPGTRYRVCVGWFDAGTVGDVSGRPQYRNEVVVHAPATSFPTVSVTDVRLDVDVPADGVSIRAAVPGGRCGGWQGPDGALPRVICDLPALSTNFDANGYITVTTEIETATGPAINHHVIDASAINCDGGCPAATESLLLPILSARPAGLCGGGDCPTQQKLGWARLSVSWPETTGRQWWELGETITGAYTNLDGDFPNMDVSAARWVLGPSPDLRIATQSAGFELVTDRPVTVEVRLEGSCFRTPEASVYRSDELRQWRNSVNFPDLCMGTSYSATVVLTDADGDVSTYAFERGDARFWPTARFSTGTVRLDLPLQVKLTAPDGEYWALGASEFSFGGEHGVRTGVSTPRVNIRRCFTSSQATVGYRINNLVAGINNRINLRVQVRETAYLSDVVSPDGFRDCALLPGADYHVFNIPVDLTLDQLLFGHVITYTDPETGIAVEIQPQPTLLR